MSALLYESRCECRDEYHGNGCQNEQAPQHGGFCTPCVFGCLP